MPLAPKFSSSLNLYNNDLDNFKIEVDQDEVNIRFTDNDETTTTNNTINFNNNISVASFISSGSLGQTTITGGTFASKTINNGVFDSDANPHDNISRSYEDQLTNFQTLIQNINTVNDHFKLYSIELNTLINNNLSNNDQEIARITALLDQRVAQLTGSINFEKNRLTIAEGNLSTAIDELTRNLNDAVSNIQSLINNESIARITRDDNHTSQINQITQRLDTLLRDFDVTTLDTLMNDFESTSQNHSSIISNQSSRIAKCEAVLDFLTGRNDIQEQKLSDSFVTLQDLLNAPNTNNLSPNHNTRRFDLKGSTGGIYPQVTRAFAYKMIDNSQALTISLLLNLQFYNNNSNSSSQVTESDLLFIYKNFLSELGVNTDNLTYEQVVSKLISHLTTSNNDPTILNQETVLTGLMGTNNGGVKLKGSLYPGTNDNSIISQLKLLQNQYQFVLAFYSKSDIGNPREPDFNLNPDLTLDTNTNNIHPVNSDGTYSKTQNNINLDGELIAIDQETIRSFVGSHNQNAIETILEQRQLFNYNPALSVKTIYSFSTHAEFDDDENLKGLQVLSTEEFLDTTTNILASKITYISTFPWLSRATDGTTEINGPINQSGCVTLGSAYIAGELLEYQDQFGLGTKNKIYTLRDTLSSTMKAREIIVNHLYNGLDSTNNFVSSENRYFDVLISSLDTDDAAGVKLTDADNTIQSSSRVFEDGTLEIQTQEQNQIKITISCSDQTDLDGITVTYDGNSAFKSIENVRNNEANIRISCGETEKIKVYVQLQKRN